MVVEVLLKGKGICVSFVGEQVFVEFQLYDLVLVVVGCMFNGRCIVVEVVGVVVDEKGFIFVDWQMCINILYIYVIGDIVGQFMLVYKVVYEVYVVVEVVVGEKFFFDVWVIFFVVYIQLEVVWVGLIESQVQVQGIEVDKGVFFWVVFGWVIVNGVEYGFIKLFFDVQDGCIVGGVIIGLNVGDMIGEVVLVIEMGVDVIDIGRIIYLYLMLGEIIGLVVEVVYGRCIDLLLLCRGKC